MTDNSSHMRNTLGLLMANQSHGKVDLVKIISKSKCSSTMVSLLYIRMLTRVLSSPRSYNHANIKMPKGVFGKIGNKDDFESWFLANERQTDMNSCDLLSLGALSGWHSAWRELLSSGLIRINDMHRIVLEYPIDGKFYSLEYAGNVLRWILKKKIEDSKEEEGVATLPVKPDTKKKNSDVPFWEL